MSPLILPNPGDPLLVSEVQASIQDLGYGADTSAAQIRMIADAQRRILSQYRWPFLNAQAALNTVAGDTAVTLDVADLVHVDAVRLAFGTDYFEPEPLALEELRTLRHSDRTPGTPRYWAEANGSVEFYPIPDKAYALTVDYTLHPPVPTLATDRLTIPAAHMDVVVQLVAKRIATRQRDWNAVATANADYVQALREMKGAYSITQRQASGRVASSSWWDDAAR
jgi:hypothetical protein